MNIQTWNATCSKYGAECGGLGAAPATIVCKVCSDAEKPSRKSAIDPDQLLALLEAAVRPVLAIEAARKLGCELAHETARRRVREAVEELRTRGKAICADTIHGIWLESRTGEFVAYLERRKTQAVGELGRVSRSRRRSQSGPMLFDGMADAGALRPSDEAFRR